MKNEHLLMKGLTIVLLMAASVSYAMSNEFSPERMDKIHEEDKKREAWLDKYIQSVLYVNMHEEEFVRIFTKDISWNDSRRPYIRSYKNDSYIIICLGDKYRVVFENNLLVKFEEYGWEKIPILTAGYRDVTYLLNGYRISEGIYNGMSEEEFLRNFSGQVLSKFKDGYEILLKNGHRRGVEFRDGILIHSWKSK